MACPVSSLSLGLTLAAAVCEAHVLARRTDLDEFVRRAEVIVRGRVLARTRSLEPVRGAYPLVTAVAVERTLKGGEAPPRIEVIGKDDHAVSYQSGQRALFFLRERLGPSARWVQDQRKGEDLYLRPGEEADWDAYLAAAARDPVGASEDYRAAIRRALASTAAELRTHALRRLSRWLRQRAARSEDVAAALAALRRRELPDRYRLAVLRAALGHLGPSDLAPLCADPGERPGVRGRVLEAWAEGAARRTRASDREAVRGAASAALVDPSWVVRLHGAAALAHLGDATGLALFSEGLAGTDATRKRVAIRGLALLARSGHVEARAALEAAEPTERDPRVRAWLVAAVGALEKRRETTAAWAWWVGIAVLAGAVAMGGAWVWRRRRRPS
jgi:hypothetical protein